jgi:hypothetical protein
MEPAANYDCEILYTEPGKENVADALSQIHIAPLSSLPNSDSKGSDANQLSEIGFYFVAWLEPCWAKHGRALCSWRKFCVSLVPCFRARNTEHGVFVFHVRVPCSHPFEEELPEHGPICVVLVTLRTRNTVGSCRLVAVFNYLNMINTTSTRHVRVGNHPVVESF